MTVDRLPFIPAWLRELDLKVSERVVFYHILSREVCYESVYSIAKSLQISHNTVRSALVQLVQKDLITGSSRPGKPAVYKPKCQLEPLPDQGDHPYQIRETTPTKIGRPPLPD